MLYMRKSDFLFILSAFLIWRITLFVFLFLALKYLPLQQNFLGGGMQNYLSNPWFWSWVNFDGEHYLTIAQVGYQPLTYFYFPVFPLLARFLGNLLGGGFTNYALAGLAVSQLAFFAALIGFWKLIRLDFNKKIARLGILLLLFFPTSFYFASYYTESVFLASVVWSFYLTRRDKWFWAGVLGGVSSATRIIGATLLPALLTEKNRKWPILLIPAGILIYMYYLNIETGDPLNFLNTVSIFGAQRSSNIIFLPQVFYRYFVKIIPNLDYNYFPVIFVTFLEILVAVLFLALLLLGIRKVKWSYLVYAALAYLIPTFSGSFSSFPRYALVIFPAFIIAALYLNKLPRVVQTLIFALLFVGLGLATCLFLRGYWVS